MVRCNGRAIEPFKEHAPRLNERNLPFNQSRLACEAVDAPPGVAVANNSFLSRTGITDGYLIMLGSMLWWLRLTLGAPQIPNPGWGLCEYEFRVNIDGRRHRARFVQSIWVCALLVAFDVLQRTKLEICAQGQKQT